MNLKLRILLIEKEWKKKEHSQVQQGKKPFFLKKSKTII
jgi:hypothetical protein